MTRKKESPPSSPNAVRSFAADKPSERTTTHISSPLTLQRDQFSVLTLANARFSLISRCTHRAHAASNYLKELNSRSNPSWGAMLKRRSNILTLFRFFVSAAIADFAADGSFKVNN